MAACGTRSAYVAGCRCDPCRKAHSAAQALWRAAGTAREVGPMIQQLPRRQWTDQAACVGTNPDMWFRDEHESTSYREARAICAACPVRTECLNWALETKTEHGLFGGLTARQRKGVHA